MDINATLFFQMVVFLFFVWFTQKFIWPPLMKAMKERRKKIIAGLNAAQRGNRSLVIAQEKAKEILRKAKQKGSQAVDQADAQAAQIVDEARIRGKEENRRLVMRGKQEVEQEFLMAKNALCAEMSSLIISGAEKILGKEVDQKAHNKMIDELIGQIGKQESES